MGWFSVNGRPALNSPLKLAPHGPPSFRLPEPDLAGDPPGEVVPVTKGSGAVYWFTGSKTIALSSADLHPLWTVDGTLGPGAVLAGYLLVPVKDGLAVIDQTTGARHKVAEWMLISARGGTRASNTRRREAIVESPAQAHAVGFR